MTTKEKANSNNITPYKGVDYPKSPAEHESALRAVGTQLHQVSDVETLQNMVGTLWDLLDAIDTADDAAKDNKVTYRAIVRHLSSKRHAVLETDGYELYVPLSKE